MDQAFSLSTRSQGLSLKERSRPMLATGRTLSVSAQALHLTAQPHQGAAINSAKFPATAGSTFTMTFVARVSPESQGSGYFNLIFDNGVREIRRLTIPLEPAVIPLGQVNTDEDGAFRFDLDEWPTSSVALRASYL